MSDFQTIKVTEDNHAARLTLARSPLNVLNIAMLKEINTFLQGLIGRDDLCVLLIAGEGKAFSAGVDVPEHTGETAEEMIGTFHRMFRLLHKLPMPTVCAAHGGVFGGGMELAIFCDIILAADNLKIGKVAQILRENNLVYKYSILIKGKIQIFLRFRLMSFRVFV